MTTYNTYKPFVNINENKEAFIITSELPGILEENLELELEQNILTIKGKQAKAEQTEDGYELIYSEYQPVNYERSFRLSDELNKEEIQAEFKHGVLTIHIPRAQKPEAKKIAINAVN